MLQVYQTIGPDGKVRNKVQRIFKDVDTANNNNDVPNKENSQMVEFCNRDVTKGAQKTPDTLVELEELEELSEPTEVLKSSTAGDKVQVLQVYRTLGPDGVVRNRVRRVFKEEGTNNNNNNINIGTNEMDQMVQFHRNNINNNNVGTNGMEQMAHNVCKEQPEKTEKPLETSGDLEFRLEFREGPEDLPESKQVEKLSPERRSRVLEVISADASNIKNQVQQVYKEEEDANNEGNVEKRRLVRFCQTGGSGEGDQKVHIFKENGIEFLHQLRVQVWKTRDVDILW